MDSFNTRRGLDLVLEHYHDASWTQIAGTLTGLFTLYSIGLIVYRVWLHPLSKYPGRTISAAFYFPHLYENYVAGRGSMKVAELHRKYGSVVRIGPNHLAIDGKIGWPQIYGHRKEEFDKKRVELPGVFENLITARRDTHRRLRRQLAHAFSDAALVQQESVVRTYVDLFVERLEHREGKSINIVEWFNFTTFDIIGDLAFSSSFGSLSSNNYHPWVKGIFGAIRSISLRRFLSNYPLAFFVAMRFAHYSILGKITQIRQKSADKAKIRHDIGEDFGNGRRDFMSYMLRKTRDGNVGMSEPEILSTSPTLVVAGSETTATALSGLFFYLGMYPRVYKMLAEEIRTAFSSADDITMQSTQKLDYLHACINEILRFYPPVTETPARVCPGAEIDGNYVPAGTTVSIYQWATFRNPEHFEDPNEFLPQRWLPTTHPKYEERFKNDNKDVFKPFSYGARDCIGKNLAMAELRLIISLFFYNFDYSLDPGQEDWHSKQRTFLIWEKGPLYLSVERRLKV